MAIGVNTFTLFIPNSEVIICLFSTDQLCPFYLWRFYCVTINPAKVTFLQKQVERFAFFFLANLISDTQKI